MMKWTTGFAVGLFHGFFIVGLYEHRSWAALAALFTIIALLASWSIWED